MKQDFKSRNVPSQLQRKFRMLIHSPQPFLLTLLSSFLGNDVGFSACFLVSEDSH